MKNAQLNNEEKELLTTFEAGEFESNLTPERRRFIEQSATKIVNKATSPSPKPSKT